MLTVLTLAAALAVQVPPPPPPPPGLSETRILIVRDNDGPGGLDTDGDGQVTRAEFSRPIDAAFDRMDTDGDGRLSTEELRAGGGPGGPGGPMVHRMERRRGGPDGAPGERMEERVMVFTDGGPGGPGGEHNVFMHRTGPEGGPMTWHATDGETRIEIQRIGDGEGDDDLDTDGDGRISEVEFLAPVRAAFARMDTDHSGAIDTAETGGAQQVRVIAHTTGRSSED
tara:strand:- start:1171 stop:1848 length:678 start_codon:yes stop_codon:yes gene_type:complete